MTPGKRTVNLPTPRRMWPAAPLIRAGAVLVHVAGCVGTPVAGEGRGLTGTCGGRLVPAAAQKPAHLHHPASSCSRPTRAGVKDAKRRGVKFGRKRKLQPAQIAHARKQIDQGQRQEDVAALFNVNRSTLYRALAG